MIINVANGPGGSGNPNADYVHGMNDLRSGGVDIVGYVYSEYSDRPLSVVEADIDKWDADFGQWVSGIFIDQVDDAAGDYEYYKQLYDYIKSKPHANKVIINAGVNIAQEFLNVSDVMTVYESPDPYWGGYVPSSYVNSTDASHYSILVYDTPTVENMRTALDLTASRHAQWVYVTDDAVPNPWDSIPSYWAEETAYAGSKQVQ